jgi:hypothetical protein
MSHNIKDRPPLFERYVLKALDRIMVKLHDIKEQGVRLMQAYDDLKAAVAAEVEVDQAVIALVELFIQKLKDLGDAPTPAQLQELTDTLTAEKVKLAELVTVNTPAA